MPQIPQQMRQDAQQQPNQLLQLLSSLLQTAPQQQAQMGVAQSDISANEQRMGGGGGQPQKPQANAYQKGVDKALNESGYAHASEALMKGSDPMMIANQSAQMGMQQQQQNVAPLLQSLLSMAQQPPQQSAQPMQPPLQQQYGNTSKGLLSKLTGMDLNPTNTGLQLDNQIKQQQLRGEQPAQEKDRYEKTMAYETARINKAMEMDKLDKTHAQTYLDSIEKQPTFSGEELTKFTALDEMTKAGSKLLTRLDKDPTALRTLGWPGDAYGQETLIWANQIAANRKFFQGGSALTPQENKTIESILAKRGIPAQFQDPKVAVGIIKGIIDKSKTVFDKMDPYSSDREWITAARGTGKYDDVTIMKALRKVRSTKQGK